MAAKFFLACGTVLACLEFLSASPTRRQLIPVTETAVSDSPATNDGEVWDDNDDFDLDGQNWYSQPAVSPSIVPGKLSDYSDYDDDFADNNRVNEAVVDLGDDDDDDDDDQVEQQEAEEVVENNGNDSEFLFLPPRDTRLLLEDDDDQSGPIKVRHTGRNTYPRMSGGSDNSVESVEEDNEHPYEFAIDEDDQDDDDDDDDEDDDPHKDGEIDTAPRHEERDVDDDDEDEDEFVSEGEDNDMFDNPEEDAAQVIYGDHVFLY